jgi:hypothetical protein
MIVYIIIAVAIFYTIYKKLGVRAGACEKKRVKAAVAMPIAQNIAITSSKNLLQLLYREFTYV